MAKSKRSSSSAHSEQLDIFSSPSLGDGNNFGLQKKETENTLQEDPDALVIDTIGLDITKCIEKFGRKNFWKIVEGVYHKDPSFDRYKEYTFPLCRYYIQETMYKNNVSPSNDIDNNTPSTINTTSSHKKKDAPLAIPSDPKIRKAQVKQFITNTFKTFTIPDVEIYRLDKNMMRHIHSGTLRAKNEFIPRMPGPREDLRERVRTEGPIWRQSIIDWVDILPTREPKKITPISQEADADTLDYYGHTLTSAQYEMRPNMNFDRQTTAKDIYVEFIIHEGLYPPDDFWVEAYEQEEDHKIMQLVESLFKEFEEKDELYMDYETQEVIYQDVHIPLAKIIEDGENFYLRNLAIEIDEINGKFADLDEQLEQEAELIKQKNQYYSGNGDTHVDTHIDPNENPNKDPDDDDYYDLPF